MAVTAYGSNTQTATIGTEHVLQDVTAAGVYSLHVDTVNMAAGDIVEIRIYQVILASGTKRLIFPPGIYYGAQATHDIGKVSLPIGNDLTDATSLEFSLKQTFGTGRAYPWKVLQY